MDKNIESKSTVITIGILLIIAIVAFFGIVTTIINNQKISNSIGYLSLDTVNITSGERSLSAKFSLSGQEKNLKDIDIDNVMYIITEELQNIDFDAITAKDGTDYLKEVVLTAINKQYEEVMDIYLESFITDVQIPDTDTNSNNGTNQSDYLKGFKWGN